MRDFSASIILVHVKRTIVLVFAIGIFFRLEAMSVFGPKRTLTNHNFTDLDL